MRDRSLPSFGRFPECWKIKTVKMSSPRFAVLARSLALVQRGNLEGSCRINTSGLVFQLELLWRFLGRRRGVDERLAINLSLAASLIVRRV